MAAIGPIYCGAVLFVTGINLASFDDPVFAVIWTAWATLWLLFFLLMALGRESRRGRTRPRTRRRLTLALAQGFGTVGP
jgi:drug/metabolite transporter (DMT)-like permease